MNIKDLTFANLLAITNANIMPANTFKVGAVGETAGGTDIAGKVVLIIDNLVNEPLTDGLNSERVSELIYKLTRAARNAQLSYNNANPSNQINSIGEITYAAPTNDVFGDLVSVATATNQFAVKVDTDEISAI